MIIRNPKRIEVLEKYTSAYLELDDETTDGLVVEAMNVVLTEQIPFIGEFDW